METPSTVADQESLVELFAGPKNARNGYDLNVILIPEVSSRVGLDWSANRGEPWPGPFLTSVTRHVRILEFVYNADLRSTFSWTTLLETGRRLFDIMRSRRLELVNSPLLIIAHGLGGIIAKQVTVLLEEGYYGPLLRQQSSILSGIVLLGTPHPSFDRFNQNPMLLDAPLSSVQSLSKSRLEKIREELPALCALSARFEGITSELPVWSAYEERPTRYAILSIFRSKTEIIIDEAFATTGLGSEQLFGIDGDHKAICKLAPNSPMLMDIKRKIELVLQLQDVVVVLGETDLAATIHARQLWGSTTESVVQNAEREDESLKRLPSPAGATAGSGDIATYEVLPSPHAGPVSQLPAVRLPCRMLGPEVGECFDRSETLKLLAEKLLPPVKSARRHIDGLRTFALSGSGGIGKTQIAREFVSRHQSRFDAVFWVNAETEGKLATSFNAIAAELDLLDPSDFGNSVVSRNRVVNWLSSPLKTSRGTGSEDTDNTPPSLEALASWLLIFDNADNLELLTEYWPMTGTGSILITSRDPLAKRYMWTGSGVDVEGFDASDGGRFLQQRARIEEGEPIQTEDAIRLSKRFGGLPFPLIRAAGILQQRNMTVDEFLDYYEERAFLAEIYGAKTESHDTQSDHGSLDAWSFDRLKTSHPEAMSLLEILALMDPDSIPEFILICEKDIPLPPKYPRSKEAYETARNVLLKSSLVKRDMDKQELSIHRIIQDSVMAQMTEDDLKTNFEGFITLLAEAWPWGNSTFNHLTPRWSRCGQVFPHVERAKDQYMKLIEYEYPEELLLTLSRLLIDAGWYHSERGNYEQSVAFVEPAIPLAEASTSATAQLVLSDAHFCLSAVKTWQRDVDATRYHSKRCLAIRLRAGPAAIARLAVAYDEAAHYQLLIKDYGAAYDLEEKSLAIYEALEAGQGDPNQLKVGNYAGNFARYCAAIALIKLGRLKDADDMITSLQTRQERVWTLMNKETFKTGLTLSVLGSVRCAQGRLDEGFDLHKDALQQFRQTIGDVHPHTASALVRVSDHLARLGEYQIANNHLEEAVNIWKNRPSFVPEMARAINKQSRVHALMGNPIKAKGLQLKAQSLLKGFARERRLPFTPELSDQDFDDMVSFWAWY